MENKEIGSEINTHFIMFIAFTTVCEVLTPEQRKQIALVLRAHAEKKETAANDERAINSAGVLRSLAEAALGEMASSVNLLRNLNAANKLSETFQALYKDNPKCGPDRS